MKRRIGFFDFTGCEGCQLTVLSLEEEFIEMLAHVEIVEFREISDSTAESLDIAFVEGSISTPAEAARLKTIREKSDILVAMGSCADNGGMNALCSDLPVARLRKEVYPSENLLLQTEAPRPLNAFAPVDYRLPGCPVNGKEFLRTLQALLIGKEPDLPSYSVCVECKLAELPCTFQREVICLGPITRAGCKAVCIEASDRCRGCRGLIDNPRSGAYHAILEIHGLTADDILKEYRTFNVKDHRDGHES